MSLPPAFKALLKAPKYAARASAYASNKMVPAGSSGVPTLPPRSALLNELFSRIDASAQQHNIAWGEWVTVAVRVLLT